MAEKIKGAEHRRTRQLFFGLESFFKRQAWPARLGLLVAAAALVVVLDILFLHYGSKLYRDWHQSRLLHGAASMRQEEKLSRAAQRAREVVKLDPDSLLALHILAEATEKQNLEETVSWRAQIARLLPNDLDSQLNLASAALRFGQLDLARKALDRVSPNDRNRAAFHVVAGWLARAEGNVAEQEDQFAAAVKKEPANDLYQFNLAALRIHSPDPEKHANARATLERLSKTTAFRTGALRALLNDAVDCNDFAGADSFAQQLQMAQQVTFNDYLLCLNFYRKLDNKKFDALLQKVKPFAARNSSDIALVMEWMNNHGLAPKVLQWLDELPSEISTQPPVAISVAEAFAAAKNWSRLKRWTRVGSWKDADYLRVAYQALGARESRQSGGEAEFNSLWRSAERQAGDQPDRQAKLARLATNWNLTVEADELWSRVARTPALRREALDALYRIYREN